MTVFSPETALEIIAGHGADPARWPPELRAAVQGLAASDAVVAAALADALTLDAALAAWAAEPVDARIDVAAILALPQEQDLPRRTGPAQRHHFRPALLAASLALVAAVGGWIGLSGQLVKSGAPEIIAASPPAGAVAGGADDAFAYVFTPTAAEEDLI